MTKVTFNTNINCASCKSTVEKAMEGKRVYKSFDVDFNKPERPATFELEDGITPNEVQRLIKEAGYKAEIVKGTSWLGALGLKK